MTTDTAEKGLEDTIISAKRGIKTPKPKIHLTRHRLRAAEQHHRDIYAG